MKRRVTVVVLCWNRWDLTRGCLASIRRTTDLADVDVIAVDNGSEDGTAAELAWLDWVRTVSSPTNVGFARGNNLGIAAAAEASDVVLLNNDAEVLTPGWLERLQRTALGSADVGIVGCRLITSDGRFANAGSFILPDTCWGHGITPIELDVGQYRADRDVQGIMFACAYLRREVIRAIGALSDRFVSYFEDTDYCLRAREAGFRTVCCGSVDVLHHEHASTHAQPGLRERLLEESRQTFRALWEQKLEDAYRHDLHWHSLGGSSRALVARERELLPVLDRSGVRVSYSGLAGSEGEGPAAPADLGDYFLNVVRARTPRAPFVSVASGADRLAGSGGRYRVGYAQADAAGVPGSWISEADELDEVWVPSGFAREVLGRAGLRRPAHVVPLGVNTNYFHPAASRLGNPRGDFVFLAVLDGEEASDAETLVRTFNRTFSRAEPVVLVCALTNGPRGGRREDTLAAGASAGGGRVLLLPDLGIPHRQTPMLYRSADCFVSASRAGGSTPALLEAMACGLPAIATGFGADAEHLSQGAGYPLRVRGLVPVPERVARAEGASWADPDPAHLSFLLRHVFEHREEAAAVGWRAAERVAAAFSLARTAGTIVARLDEIDAAIGKPRP